MCVSRMFTVVSGIGASNRTSRQPSIRELSPCAYGWRGHARADGAAKACAPTRDACAGVDSAPRLALRVAIPLSSSPSTSVNVATYNFDCNTVLACSLALHSSDRIGQDALSVARSIVPTASRVACYIFFFRVMIYSVRSISGRWERKRASLLIP
jgi:hypothetical protein